MDPRLVVRVQEAGVVADGGPGWFVVSGLPDPQAVAERAASAGGSVDVVDGRLRALVTPTQLVNAAGRVDAELGQALRDVVDPAVEAWRSAPPDVALPRSGVLDCSRRPQVMGIVNVTPDSFSDGGAAYDPADHPGAAVRHGLALLDEGADLLDVGGESTRPGSDPVPEDEELRRVVPVVEALAAEGATVSIDTSKARVAAEAVAAGAVLVNDVSAGRTDDELLGTVAELGVPYVLMHMQGTPATMQTAPTYADVVSEVYEFLAAGLADAAAAGIPTDRVIVDPGIGFGKTVDHNAALLRAVREFTGLGRPVLVGASRKSFIGRLAGAAGTGDRLAGSLAVAAGVVQRGASIVRVHDVAATRQAVDVAAALRT